MKRTVLNSLISCLLVIGLASLVTASGAISVGVNSEDWAEYSASYVGSPSDNFMNWTRIEVNEIQGSNLTVYITAEFLNGKYDTEQGCYDLQKGIPGLFIIPANFEVNNQFYHQDYGNITIEGTKELTCADSKRTAVYSTVNQTKLHWDQTTGVLLQLEVSWNDFNQKLLLQKTNMWQTQQSGPETTIVYLLLITVGLLVFCYVLNKHLKNKKRLPRLNYSHIGLTSRF
jgi:hypothetical protein